jgi:hypothetical protein
VRLGALAIVLVIGTASAEAQTVPLRTLIQMAYNVGTDRLVGGPAWTHTERVDMVADGELLSSPSERQSTATDCTTLRRLARSGDQDPCGLLTVARGLITGRMSVRGMEMFAVAGILARDAGRPVADKTGLKGIYDWELTWTPQVPLQGRFNRKPFPVKNPVGSSIFAAVPEQLGLSLLPQSRPVDVVVIDRVILPTDRPAGPSPVGNRLKDADPVTRRALR